jgi:hypothetical protein
VMAKSSCDHALNELEPADLDDVAGLRCVEALSWARPLPEHGDTAPWLHETDALSSVPCSHGCMISRAKTLS